MINNGTVDNDDHLQWTCEIVASYVANNTLPPNDVPGFIQSIHSSIASIAAPKATSRPSAEPSVQPSVQSSAKTSEQPVRQTLEQPSEQLLEEHPVEPPIAENRFPQLPANGAISVRKSISNPDFIISMIDGKPYKMLARQLSRFGISPDDYRSHFKLPADYPMVAPAYSESRRSFAINSGFGNKARQTKKK